MTTSSDSAKTVPTVESILDPLKSAQARMEIVNQNLSAESYMKAHSEHVDGILSTLVTELPHMMSEYVKTAVDTTDFLDNMDKNHLTIAGLGVFYLKSLNRALEVIYGCATLTSFALRDRGEVLTRSEQEAKTLLESVLALLDDAARLIRKEKTVARDVVRGDGLPTVLLDAALTDERSFQLLLVSGNLVKEEYLNHA